MHVAFPGVAAAPLAAGTAGGGRLLCVAAVSQLKGHDLLVAALASVADLPWRCTCVGSLDVDPGFAQAVRDQAGDAGIGDRIAFTGPLAHDDLGRTYADADLLVLGSRTESWGMVAAEALARGLPVLGPDVGGLPEALGPPPTGRCRGCWCPRMTPRPWAWDCGAGSPTYHCARRGGRRRRNVGNRCRPGTAPSRRWPRSCMHEPDGAGSGRSSAGGRAGRELRLSTSKASSMSPSASATCRLTSCRPSAMRSRPRSPTASMPAPTTVGEIDTTNRSRSRSRMSEVMTLLPPSTMTERTPSARRSASTFVRSRPRLAPAISRTATPAASRADLRWRLAGRRQ